MTDRIRRLYEMFSRVLNFMTANAADFQSIPFVAATVANLQTEVTKIANLASDKVQFSAAAKDSTISRGDARDALREAMEDIRDVWKSSNSADNKFRMPRGSNDQNLIATANAFVSDAQSNQQIFTDRGLPADFIADLQAKINDFTQAVNISQSAYGERVGTNAAFDEPVQKCKSLVGDIEPVVKRTYRTNQQKWTEWLIASRVERAPRPGSAGSSENPNTQPQA